MIENLINYYSSNLTFYSIVTKKNGIMKNSFFWVATLISAGLLFYFQMNNLYILCFSIIPLLFASILIGRYFNAMTIKKLYPEIYISRFKWSNEMINVMIYNRLDSYLKEENLFNKTGEIKRLISEKAKNERLPFIICSSAFMALFLPLWYSYIEKVLDYFKSDLKAITSIALFITILIGSIIMYFPMIYSLRDRFLSRYKKLNDLSELLDEYELMKK